MNWNECTLNPKIILGYYESAPSLEQVELHRVSLLRDGPMAEIVFDVPEFPQKPSSRWPVGANTCQITLRAIGLAEVAITEWGKGVFGQLEIRQTCGAVEVSFSGEGRFTFLCSHVDVASVTGYVRSRA